MSTLTLPGFPVTAGQVIDPDLLNIAMFDPTNPEDSFAVVNGLLDEENLGGSLVLTKEMHQRGSAIEMSSSSGTANLDYRFLWFGDYALDESFTVIRARDPVIPIPGGCRSVFVKWPAAQALVMWTVFVTSGNFRAVNDSHKTSVLLTVDGALSKSQFRPIGMLGESTDDPDQYAKSRVWSGHALVPLERGWHDIGLNVLADAEVPLTRIHAVSIAIVILKNDPGLIPVIPG